MKIAIVRTDCSSQDITSYNSQELGLALGLAKLGNTVDIFLGSKERSGSSVISDCDPGVRIRYVGFHIISILEEPYYNQFLRPIFKEENYDLVQINEEGNFSSYLITRLCMSLGLPYVIYQGMYKVLSGRKWRLYESIHHRFLRPAMQRGALTAFCKTTSSKRFLEARGYTNCSVLPVGLNFDVFDDCAETDWRTKLGIGDTDKVILYVGALEARRNPNFLLRLAERVPKGYVLVAVGDGPEREAVERARVDYALKNIHFLGKLPQKELPSLYRQSDVFVLPSNYEIYGMVVIEALFFGVPVVSTPTAGPADILTEFRLGTVIQGLNSDDWLNSIVRYCEQEDSESDRSWRSENALQQFDWAAIAGKYVSLVDAAFRETSRP
ncbi:MAG: glycosyltransferase family 4 protein [Sphingobacterium sp.]